VLLYGSDFERHQQMYDAYGQPIPLTQQQEVLKDPQQKDEHYWSEYRRNYEIALRRKIEEDRLKVQSQS
jgi:hypothetical protein